MENQMMKASLSLRQRINDRIYALSVEYRELCADFDAAVACWDTARMDSLSRSIALARHAIGRLQRDVGGNVAIEFGLLLSVFAPIVLYAGERIGPALLQWASTLNANVAAAQHLLTVLGGAS
jgi:hypothetical protein